MNKITILVTWPELKFVPSQSFRWRMLWAHVKWTIAHSLDRKCSVWCMSVDTHVSDAVLSIYVIRSECSVFEVEVIDMGWRSYLLRHWIQRMIQLSFVVVKMAFRHHCILYDCIECFFVLMYETSGENKNSCKYWTWFALFEFSERKGQCHTAVKDGDYRDGIKITVTETLNTKNDTAKRHRGGHLRFCRKVTILATWPELKFVPSQSFRCRMLWAHVKWTTAHSVDRKCSVWCMSVADWMISQHVSDAVLPIYVIRPECSVCEVEIIDMGWRSHLLR